jgi:hypothetical protein
MNKTQTIQEANVAELEKIDPTRITVVPLATESFMDCDLCPTKGVCYLTAEGSKTVDILCLKDAIRVAEMWLQDPGQHVVVAVVL